MRLTSTTQSVRDNSAVSGRVLGGCSLAGVLCGLLGLGVGCGVEEPAAMSWEDLRGRHAAQLSSNGLSTNGLSTNGFVSWFNLDPTTADSVMHYVVTCALAANDSRTFTNPVTGATYTWHGGLGLATAWAQGNAATLQEQQVVSACLAAHANKYGMHVPISVLGRSATNTEIPYSSGELSTYGEQEGCFFGNLFDGTGVFAANDQPFLSADRSTPRTCGLASSAGQTDCAPIVQVGQCATLCTVAQDGSGAALPYYEKCTYGGVEYQPITTRIRAQDIYQCGDGTCQFTEHCGTGATAQSCQSDCGACAP